MIKADEYGLDNVVSIGSASLSDYQFSLITRYTDNIHLLLDNDEAGERGRKRIMDRFKQYANIINFYLPQEYKDVDEYLTKDENKSLSFVIKD
jgi:DNA primase